MAKRRSERPWWSIQPGLVDDGERGGMPFTFMQVEHLDALGLVAWDNRWEIPSLDGDLLAAWTPPANASDGLVLELAPGSTRVTRSTTGTRIDTLAAQALWELRADLEDAGLLTMHAWCTHCGRHFVDKRRGYFTTAARWCPAHRNVRTRHLAQGHVPRIGVGAGRTEPG